ncbi:hypothetical protein EJ05DRAFT_508710 [Pseudovirgaria hyperparasitica]|uniref:Uncharacterized protein n=1 Tax=Pseudovirgaria hyperparasitica TaxID=470096 RepID=A0A6A6WD82_9PEZI|nr:uncharacterized protein EJ05DRAFT_508710 [Pseudovirgaria hyperparasitica]KAF2760139.1 hypothetical protein EJ05DRAFT_508710 [Pseudovirgaria hyperparasitica]
MSSSPIDVPASVDSAANMDESSAPVGPSAPIDIPNAKVEGSRKGKIVSLSPISRRLWSNRKLIAFGEDGNPFPDGPPPSSTPSAAQVMTAFNLPIRRRSDTVSTDSSSTVGATVPVNTPGPRSITGFAGEPVQMSLPVDVSRVATRLDAIEEHHNDAVSLDFSRHGRTNPDNSPFGSPTPSLYAQPTVPMLGSSFHTIIAAESSVTSPRSVRSATPSISEGDTEGNRGLIHVALGSPRSRVLLPDISSRMSGSPRRVALSTSLATLRPDNASRLRLILPGQLGHPGPCGPGVYEHTDWSNYAFEDVEKGLVKLENLAQDLSEREPRFSKEEHYRVLLTEALNKQGRINPFRGNVGGISVPSLAEFEELKLRMEQLEEVVRGMRGV